LTNQYFILYLTKEFFNTSTHIGRLKIDWRGSASGHEELSLPLKLSGRCGSGKRPLAVKDQESGHPIAWHLSM